MCCLAGTFPYVDNFAHLSGFVFGIVSAVIFLPYITFGLVSATCSHSHSLSLTPSHFLTIAHSHSHHSKWDVARKRFLLLLAVPLLFAMFIVAFVLFYSVQNTEFCTWCKYIDCFDWGGLIDCEQQSILS